MKKARFYLVLITIFSAMAACSEKRESLKTARQAINDSNYRQAILTCNEILLWDSTAEIAYIYRGSAFEHLKDYKSAARDYTSAIHFNPTGCYGYMYRAILLGRQERYEYCFPDFQQALDNAPTDTLKGEILMQRAIVWNKARNFEKGIADAEAALKYLPNNLHALNSLGIGLMETNHLYESTRCFEQIIKIDSNFEGCYQNLGFVYGLMGQYKESLNTCNKALSIRPNQPYMLNNRGYSKMGLNDLNGALQDINRSIQLMPGNSYAFRNRGLLYLRLKMNDQACDDFQTALKLDFTKQYGNEVEELVKTHCIK